MQSRLYYYSFIYNYNQNGYLRDAGIREGTLAGNKPWPLLASLPWAHRRIYILVSIFIFNRVLPAFGCRTPTQNAGFLTFVISTWTPVINLAVKLIVYLLKIIQKILQRRGTEETVTNHFSEDIVFNQFYSALFFTLGQTHCTSRIFSVWLNRVILVFPYPLNSDMNVNVHTRFFFACMYAWGTSVYSLIWGTFVGSARNLLVTWEISGQVLSLAHNGHPSTRWSCLIVHMTWPLRVSVLICCVARV